MKYYAVWLNVDSNLWAIKSDLRVTTKKICFVGNYIISRIVHSYNYKRQIRNARCYVFIILVVYL